MKRGHKIALGILTSIVGLAFLAYTVNWMIAPGSYSRAETYDFNISEEELIKIIQEVKSENPELELKQKVKIPNGSNIEMEEGRKDENDFWYSIYFYYPDKNEILHTWTRPKNDNITTFALVSINNGLTLGNWRTVNESFWWWKNEPEIEEFERRILKKIEEKTNAQQRL